MKSLDAPPAVRPPLKWVGGKRALLPQLRALLPERYGTYWEPFLGGGALFFAQRPDDARLSDVNPELIATYVALRDSVDLVIAALERHAEHHRRDLLREPLREVASHQRLPYYYLVRSQAPDDLPPVERAARMLYLNRTCFNGLYRVNRRGQFNVPAGRYADRDIVQAAELRRCSAALAGTSLAVHGFDAIEPRAGDLVYLDPPYDSEPGRPGFTQYAAAGFDAADQQRVRDVAARAVDAGATVLVSNSSTALIRELYADGRFDIHVVQAPRRVGQTASSRKPVEELLIRGPRAPK